MPKLIEVKPLENYRIWVKYSDGVEGVVNLSELVGKGVFAAWKDYREFQKVHIGPAEKSPGVKTSIYAQMLFTSS
ncbi:MAG: DUF2442 domain-containing protein [candidate division KSB1 bacterium]|nr:DUF2442 domain-containing protein [candidate division KSB1 bacterium]